MIFQEALEKKFYYNSEKELFEDKNRITLWEQNKKVFSEISKELYFNYDVKKYYFINEFIEKTNNIEIIHIMFELNKSDFEDLVDSMLLNEVDSDIQFYCSVDSELFVLDESWKIIDCDINKIQMSEFLI